jgi:lipopolysaccharide export system protein LptA
MGSLKRGLLVAVWGAAAAIPAGAQEGCEFGDQGNDVVVSRTIPGVGRVTYVTRPHFVCRGGLQIWADSAVAYGDRGMSHLIGAVRYLETGRELHADEARYFSNEGRLQANGDVSVRDDAQGSSIHNGDLVYLLETDFRDVAEMTVTTGADRLRPVAVLAAPPPDSGSASERPQSPYTVEGDRIFLRGSGYFAASGTVEIVRDSLFAYADSSEYDEAGDGLALEGAARVDGADYTLTGRRITMSPPGGTESEIHAVRDARLTGEGLLLTSAQIFLFLRDDALDRLVATPIVRRADADSDSVDLVRPRAVVDDFVLDADSLEVNSPAERIERVFAAGSARSVSTSSDSLNVERLPDVARTDWLEGDTVIVTFAPPVAGVEGEEREVDQIVARGGARSLYRLPASDSTARAGTDPPAVHYVVGGEIRIVLEAGEVEAMHVVGQTSGVHLEPLRRVPPADTTVADSAATGARIPPDTLDLRKDAVAASARDPDDLNNDEPKTGRHRRESRRRLEEVPWIRP